MLATEIQLLNTGFKKKKGRKEEKKGLFHSLFFFSFFFILKVSQRDFRCHSRPCSVVSHREFTYTPFSVVNAATVSSSLCFAGRLVWGI